MTLKQVLQTPFSKLVLSNKKDKTYLYNKVQIEPVLLKKKNAWQVTSYTDKQAFQKNIFSLEELLKHTEELFQKYYRQVNVFGATEDIEIKISKRGKLFANRISKTAYPGRHGSDDKRR